MKYGAKFLSSSGRLSFARSPDKSVLTFVCTYDLRAFVAFCAEAARKATNALRSIRGSLKSITKESFIIIFNTYVRPHLEYWVQVWKPYLRKDIDTRESSAKSNETGERYIPAPLWGQTVWIWHVERRCDRGDLIELYKMFTKKGYISGQRATSHWQETTEEAAAGSLKS